METESPGRGDDQPPPPPMLHPDHHYYEILGVAYSATDAELRKAYRKKAAKYHPDKQKGKDEATAAVAIDMFEKANHAYKILTDATKREAYNKVITKLWEIEEG